MRIPNLHANAGKPGRVHGEYSLQVENAENRPREFDYKTIQVDLKPSEYVDDLGLFENEKELHRFVVRTKYYIRKSREYKELMKFLKKYRGMNCCGVHPNLKQYNGFQIQIHHTPLVIEDIIYIIINKRLKLKEPMKQSAIAKEVMYLHYLGLIGLYPLCETCHEYAHGDTNDLFIPLDSIFGDPEKFFEIYDQFISSVMKVKFRNIQELNKGYSIIRDEIPDGLVKQYIYVTTKGRDMVSTKALYDFIVELKKD